MDIRTFELFLAFIMGFSFSSLLHEISELKKIRKAVERYANKFEEITNDKT